MKLLQAGLVLAVFLVRRVSSQGPKIQPGGTQSVSEAFHIYGNNVTWRKSPLPSGAKKSWVDFEAVLPSGRLTWFYVYVGKNISRPSDMKTSNLRLHIWRPTKGSIYEYTLVYSRTVQVDITDPLGRLYACNVTSDGFRVILNDKIGWTDENTFGLISIDYNAGHHTYFRKYENTDYPTVNNRYTFDTAYLPSIFSIAVKINYILATTGSPGKVVTTVAPKTHVTTDDGGIQGLTTTNVGREEDVVYATTDGATSQTVTVGDSGTNNTPDGSGNNNIERILMITFGTLTVVMLVIIVLLITRGQWAKCGTWCQEDPDYMDNLPVERNTTQSVYQNLTFPTPTREAEAHV